ncbi:conserved hypothetical protein [Sphingomonas sp. EC-HK361]|uniref:DUF1826 domain-containing protein n=1 Tax=Sphingomonas sp. EC-HK361 TaxID=2038397 RepID=UPI00125AF34B|nr:DUF1826 domain-containing protein [Sphingomonas sp. EC-HK361]VVT22092.1 conserved hypothetical protein [Sphingomonas sp. EC-HK361]
MATVLSASHAVEHDDPVVLRSILQEAINIAIWNRPPPFRATQHNLGGFTEVRLRGDPTTIDAALAASDLTDLPFAEALRLDIAFLAARFADIMATDEVEVRLERVTTNACWKFHADYTTARLITTYIGQGTEWCDAAAAKTRRLATGAVGLFKGRDWAPDNPIVHRSPPIAGTGKERLLLVIDPARPPLD